MKLPQRGAASGTRPLEPAELSYVSGGGGHDGELCSDSLSLSSTILPGRLLQTAPVQGK